MRKREKKLKKIVIDTFRAEADKTSDEAKKEMKRAAEELAARGALGGGAQVVEYLQLREKQIENTISATLSRLSEILANRWLEWVPWTDRLKEVVVSSLDEVVRNRYRGPLPSFHQVSEKEIQAQMSVFMERMKGQISVEVATSIDSVIRGKQQDAVKFYLLGILTAVLIRAALYLFGL